MNYLSVCSGIEAATVAWHPLGWTPAAFSEIERFPCELLAHHYPTVPNLGDMTKFKEWPDANIDVLVGGTPCQAFSVAGLRKGLADPRGNLTLTYLAIAARFRPRWVVWENVPGVFSDDEGAFGTFLSGLAELGYMGGYRVLDARYFGVAQRRRRPFVVGHLGDWRRAAAVLFELESLCGNPPPSGEAGKGTASRAQSGFDVGGTIGPRVSRLTTDECANGAAIVAHALRADGFDASEDGTGRGIPLVCGTLSDGAHMGGGLTDRTPTQDELSRCLNAGGMGRLDWETETFVPVRTGGGFDETIAFSSKDYGADAANDCAPTLRAMGHDGSHANAGGQIAVAIQGAATRENPDSGPDGIGVRTDDTAYTLEARAEVQAVAFNLRGRAGGAMPEEADAASMRAASGGSSRSYIAFGQQNSARQGASASASVTPTLDKSKVPGVGDGMRVRRLTPRECERLQGFPDDYTLIPRKGGKLAADGPRYKALGNSMAVPVMRWIGERIALVDAL